MTIRVAKLQLSGAKEEVDRGSEVEGLGVLVVELDRTAAMVEREPWFVPIESFTREVVLGLGLPHGVRPAGLGTS